MHDSEQEHSGITGCRVTYESTIFYNEANKFSIIVVKTSDPRIPPQACSGRYYGDRMLRFTAVGYELPRTKAVELELDGEWVESKYGYQLQVEQWQEIVPQTADGLLAYLGSGLIRGIGPKTAEDIVATFGPDTLNILDNEPEKLLQIRGITEGKLKDIEESYAESRVLRNLMSLLGPFKITPATALKIYQNFGPACVDILKKCPYDLCQISGFGFKRVDGIVRKTDNRLHSAERIKGAVLYTLEDARSKSGHLFLPSEDLVKETLLLLNAPIPILEQRVRAEEVQETLQQMILHGAVVAYKQYLYSPRVFGQEDDTARMIAERLANISVAENIESALESVRESLGITLSQKQEQAVRTAFQHGLTIITGSPGTGKTTVLKAIIEVFKNLHPKGKFALMAPTGRASRRMAESTGVDEARTLHSALGLGTGEEIGDGERVRFVDADLVIVDEFSMVDMWLAQQFFKRISQHTRVVLVGDPNQLPSVGAGNVFYELIHSGMVPVTVLDWIFRQSKDGLIAYNAKFINEGSTKLYYGNDFVFVDSPTQIETARRIQDIYCKEAAERGIENVQILSPFREKGEAASEQLNRAIRERVNPFRSAEEEVKIGNRTFRVHDRVMQTKNTEKVSNGDLGFITGITTDSKGERLVQMDFGGDRKLTYTPEQLAHVDLAYATTIHKAMGSEFETVIIPIVKAHTIMLYRNLLYTAVTRAKKKVILVGHKPILFMAVHRADISKRNTMLGERIRLWFAYMTARKFMRYMDSQLPDYMQLKRAFLYRSPMEEAISTYSDYLQMCQGQNYDMKSSQVLFPKHCNEAHDELSRYIKKCRDEQTKRAFREVYENLAEKANLTSKKLQIVCPKQTDDLITEGQALHHCVGTYIERVAAKKCLIVFVRRVEEPEKPFVTVEVSNGKIVQIRGERNSDPTKEVKKFVDLWSRKVLPMALQTA